MQEHIFGKIHQFCEDDDGAEEMEMSILSITGSIGEEPMKSADEVISEIAEMMEVYTSSLVMTWLVSLMFVVYVIFYCCLRTMIATVMVMMIAKMTKANCSNLLLFALSIFD